MFDVQYAAKQQQSALESACETFLEISSCFEERYAALEKKVLMIHTELSQAQALLSPPSESITLEFQNLWMLLSNLGLGLIQLDASNVIQHMNDAACHWFGEDLLEKPEDLLEEKLRSTEPMVSQRCALAPEQGYLLVFRKEHKV